MTLVSRATVALLLSAAVSAAAELPAGAVASARSGKVDEAIAQLRPLKSAEAESLRCALYNSVDQIDKAVEACQAAVSSAPGSSDYTLALARTYGSKADHSGAFTGMRMVGKIRGNFEKAVQLNPRSVEALSDLGQFYVEAPGIVGGGTDKAQALVAQLQPLSAARAHRLSAMIAAKAKDDAKGEAEFKAAIAASHTPESYFDLANFYRGHKQADRAADTAKAAIKADAAHGPDSLDAAALLLDLKRDTSTAQAALRAYLAAPQTGVASYARAHALLGESLLASGDKSAADAEFAAALALAADYPRAKKDAR